LSSRIRSAKEQRHDCARSGDRDPDRFAFPRESDRDALRCHPPAFPELAPPEPTPNRRHQTDAVPPLQDLALAYLESTAQTDAYRFDIELNRPLAPTPPGQPQQFGPQVQVTITRQEWVQE
jgi:hypothetical protein